ncbi:hypothetical protein ES703_12825 [subsurface metagenome]
MTSRKRKPKSANTFGVVVDFAETVDTIFERFTGKPIAAWLKEFQQQPRELPGGEQKVSAKGTMSLADAYAILGLTPNAPLEQVKKHYRNLAKVFHSDMGAMNDEAMKLLNRAYEQIQKHRSGSH